MWHPAAAELLWPPWQHAHRLWRQRQQQHQLVQLAIEFPGYSQSRFARAEGAGQRGVNNHTHSSSNHWSFKDNHSSTPQLTLRPEGVRSAPCSPRHASTATAPGWRSTWMLNMAGWHKTLRRTKKASGSTLRTACRALPNSWRPSFHVPLQMSWKKQPWLSAMR